MELVFTRTFHFCQNVTVERHPRPQFPNIFLKDLVSFLYTKQMNADFFQPTINFTELNLAAQAAWVRVCLSQPGVPGPPCGMGQGQAMVTSRGWDQAEKAAWEARPRRCPGMRLADGG